MAGTYEQAIVGEPVSTGDPKILKQLEGMNAKLNSGNLLEDTGLASPNNSAYRLIVERTQSMGEGTAVGTYPLMNLSSNPIKNANTVGTLSYPYFQFVKADYAVANKTQKLRLRAQVAVNTIQPTIKFTFGLYPITVAGAGNTFFPTMGTVVSGSTVEVKEPTASTITSAEGSDFTIPADGAYVLGVVLSGQLTAESSVKLGTQLQTRSV